MSHAGERNWIMASNSHWLSKVNTHEKLKPICNEAFRPAAIQYQNGVVTKISVWALLHFSFCQSKLEVTGNLRKLDWTHLSCISQTFWFLSQANLQHKNVNKLRIWFLQFTSNFCALLFRQKLVESSPPAFSEWTSEARNKATHELPCQNCIWLFRPWRGWFRYSPVGEWQHAVG